MIASHFDNAEKTFINMAESREITNKINNVVGMDKSLMRRADFYYIYFTHFVKVAPFLYLASHCFNSDDFYVIGLFRFPGAV